MLPLIIPIITNFIQLLPMIRGIPFRQVQLLIPDILRVLQQLNMSIIKDHFLFIGSISSELPRHLTLHIRYHRQITLLTDTRLHSPLSRRLRHDRPRVSDLVNR